MSKNECITLGIMSGTSLDGLDLAICKFREENSVWTFEILAAQTIEYPREIADNLEYAHKLMADSFLLFHNEYGRFIGMMAKEFISKSGITPQLIASHGHTIFHQPKNKFTFQIGNAAEIASINGINTVADFRSLDVALGGQGAPLVPIGDALLFSEYDICLNLGGFANLSVESNGRRIAYDLGAFNFVLNNLASKLGFAYDDSGAIGKNGKLNLDLVNQLNSLEFYKQKAPKSLAREWVEQEVFPKLEKSSISVENKLASYYEHISSQLANEINKLTKKNVLVTGGGAYNNYFIELLKAKCEPEIIVPSKEIIDFKEALIFAFLGVLRYQNKINTYSLVTGAKFDSSGGIVYKI